MSKSRRGKCRAAGMASPRSACHGCVIQKTEETHTKKVCSACWKAAIGQSASGNAAWRCARTCAAGRGGGCVGTSGGGHRPNKAVRILLWPRSNRFQMRCKVRSLRQRSAAKIAAAMPSATARSRNLHRQPVVRLSRRILSAHQTLKVRPQPGRALRLLQKTRRARTVFRWGLLSSNPRKKPCRISVPTTLQCGHGVCLSRSAIATHSSSPR